MTERRVQFDFDITFSNGGGLRGRGFRLDIDGEDISDDAPADYLVRDLRLLMVGSGPHPQQDDPRGRPTSGPSPPPGRFGSST